LLDGSANLPAEVAQQVAEAGGQLGVGERYIDLLERHSDLLVAAGAIEADGRGPYTLYATHLAILIAEAAPQLDAPLTARSLLATLGPGHFVHARRALGWEVERLKAGWAAMTAALCASSS